MPGLRRGGGCSRSPIITDTRALHAVEDQRCRRPGGPGRAAFRARRCGIAAPAPRGTASPRRLPQPTSSTSWCGSAGTAAARNTGSIATRAPSAGCRRRTRPPSRRSSVTAARPASRLAHRSSSSAAAITRPGAAVVAFGDHQAARDRADAAFDEAGMMVEHEAVDPGVAAAAPAATTGGRYRWCAAAPSWRPTRSRPAAIARPRRRGT